VQRTDLDKLFAGSIPQLYDQYLVPLIFEPYAVDMAARLASHDPSSVLEIAAGTGAVTRALTQTLSQQTSITATDLNQAMLQYAQSKKIDREIKWQQADASQLPFENATFEAVICQFGAMFFPDRARAFSEARRVLKPGGVFIFSVWDRIEENEFADVVTVALESVFPEDPPRFLARTPHGYHDPKIVKQDVLMAGFTAPIRIETISARSKAESARIPAVAYCEGTPLRNEIEAHDHPSLHHATNVAEDAIARRFGCGAVDGKIQAHVITVGK
jgi:SAM-dependent methyltransferase